MPTGIRQQGVRALPTQGVAARESDHLDVIAITPLELFGVNYNLHGKSLVTLAVKSGDMFYFAPEGEQWIKSLKPCSKKMTANLQEAYLRMNPTQFDAEVPSEDQVDILAADIHKEASEQA